MQVREFGAIMHNVAGIFLHDLNHTYGAHVHMFLQKCWGVGCTYITCEYSCTCSLSVSLAVESLGPGVRICSAPVDAAK